MSPLEIALIIIGVIIIIISCVLVDKSGEPVNKAGTVPFTYENNVSEEDKKKLMDRIHQLVNEISEDTVVRTDDNLSQLSNEKIMAVHEYAEQLLEKINRNHEEVVFLYNMLNDKEKELKLAVKEIDDSRKIIRELAEVKADAVKSQNILNGSMNAADKPLAPAGTYIQNIEGQEELALDNLNSNKNSEILELYTKGKSVMEISRLLELGQGEVKLVIDLFKGKK